MSGLPTHADMPVEIAGNYRMETRGLLALGLPMAATQFVQHFIYTIDIVMISRISAEDVAAAGLALVVNFLLWMIGAGPVMAVTPLVAQAIGRGTAKNQAPDYTDIRHSLRMALWLIVALMPLLCLIIYFMVPIAVAFGQDEMIARKAQGYMAVLAVGWPFALGVMALRNFLAAINKTTIPFLLIVMTTALNAFFNYILIFGNFGAPRLELIGAGIASTLATIITFGIFIAYISWDKDARVFQIFKDWYRPVWSRFREVLALGWPISVTTIFEGMLFNAGVLLMGAIGIMEMAAYQIGLNIASSAFMIPWGLSMAGAVRIGHAAGAGNLPAAKRAAVTCVIVATLIMTALALLIYIYQDLITALYVDAKPENAAVRALVLSFIPLAAGFMFFDAVQVAANQLLRGLKDVQVPMFMTGFCYWIVGFPVALYLGLKTDVGASGIWYGLTAGLFCASILLGGRLYYILWRKEQLVVEADA